MAEEFKIGDIVYLKSGSPPLTVIDAKYTNAVWVAWVGDEPAMPVFRESFPHLCLTHTNPRATPPPEAREPQGA